MSEKVRATPAAAGHDPRMSDHLSGSISSENTHIPSRNQRPQSKAGRLAKQLLRDRERHCDGSHAVSARSRPVGSDFDPFAVTCWRAIAGGNPGYLVKTPMRRGPVGWFIACQGCGAEFESKGWSCCPKCMELPAEERLARRKAVKRLLRPQAAAPPAPSPQNSDARAPETSTEIIKEFPPVFGPADWPTNLIGSSSRRGRLLPPGLAGAVVQTEVAFLLGDVKRRGET
jgi:hypothetical protein